MKLRSRRRHTADGNTTDPVSDEQLRAEAAQESGADTDSAEVDPSILDAPEADGHGTLRGPSRGPSKRHALAAALTMLITLSGLAVWLGHSAHQAREATQSAAQFVEVAKQGALNLANISSDSVDDDVQRVISTSTGAFLTDFRDRSPGFVDFVRQAKSHSEATVRAAGLESSTDTEARVLVALMVKVTTAGVPQDGPPRSWRMRLTVQKTNQNELKLSNVEFVP